MTEESISTTRIGVIGGGQLALMLGEAARRMGFAAFSVIDPTPQCPAEPVATHHIVAPVSDAAAIRQLAEMCDILTIEIEQVNVDILYTLEKAGHTVYPAAHSIAIIQDKLRQKEHLAAAGIAVAPFRAVEHPDDVAEAAREFGFPCVLKARTQGYDGRGNVVLNSPADIPSAFERLAGRSLYLEQHIPFVKELAVMVARRASGEIAVYPVVEMIHRRNICHEVLAPAEVDVAVAEHVQSLALRAVDTLQSAGIFGVELFLSAAGEVYLNEIAPRPHNSGHYTIEACETSQYEQHLRAICDLPLGSVAMVAPAAVMVNILGEDPEPHPARPSGMEEAGQLGAYVHIYGKHQTIYDRKMGHLTVLGTDVEETLQRARLARASITI